MKKIYFIYSILLVLFFTTNRVHAQEGSLISINYAPALPLGNTASFVSNFTGRGVSLEYYFMKTKNSGFGIELGTNGFADKRVNETLNSGTVSITGTQFRALSVTSLLPSYIFVIGDNSKFKPYVAMGAGLVFLTQQADMGIFVQKETTTQIGFRPEVGAMLKVSDYVGIKISTRYAQTLANNSMDAQSILGFNLGFVMLNF